MYNSKEFRSIISAERSEKIFRNVIKKQELGEIRTEKQLREELEKQIQAVSKRGQITFEIPIYPGEIVSSNAIKEFFEMVSSDIDIIFLEIDHTDELIVRQAEIIKSQLQSLKFSLGQLKSEGIQKKIRVKPGAGFTKIARDSFDRGYSDLAGRAEVPYDLFKDIRSVEDAAKAESVPIQADARVEGIGKKLILPATLNKNIGFKNIKSTETEEFSVANGVSNWSAPNSSLNIFAGANWIFPENLLYGDDEGSAVSAPSVPDGVNEWLYTSVLNILLPEDIVIVGLEVRGIAYGNGKEADRRLDVHFTKGGLGNLSSKSYTITPGDTTLAREDGEYFVLGGSNNLWGEDWTREDITSDGFGLAISRPYATSDEAIANPTDNLVLVKILESRVHYYKRGPIYGTNIEVEDLYPIYNAIDGKEDTFWSHTIGKKWPATGTPVANVTRIQGISGVDPTISLINLKDPRPQDYYVKIVGWSGVYPVVTSMATADSYIGAVCQYDTGTNCFWKYDKQYAENCINTNCSRYSTNNTSVISGAAVAIEDGFGYDTGATINWENFSGLSAGTTFKISNQTSGTVGQVIELELELTTPGYINWIELDPVVDYPFSITKMEYSKPKESERFDITSENINVSDKIRIDMPKIEAEKIFLEMIQSNYRDSEIISNPKQDVVNKIIEIESETKDPTPKDLEDIELPILLEDFARSPDLKDIFAQNKWSPVIKKGSFYQFGIFELNCGLSSYAEKAIAISKVHRSFTPTMIGLQANLEPGILMNYDGGDEGTFEFSIIKINFDENKSLINIQDFPIPVISNGIIQEKLILSSDKSGNLRFAANSIESIKNLESNEYLSLDEYALNNENSSPKKSFVSISNKQISSSSSLLISYMPKYGLYLDRDKLLKLEDNRSNQLSLSNISSLITCSPKIKNRDVYSSDIYVRIIIRRNSNDSFITPKLRDYQLLVNEKYENRFFV